MMSFMTSFFRLSSSDPSDFSLTDKFIVIPDSEPQASVIRDDDTLWILFGK